MASKAGWIRSRGWLIGLVLLVLAVLPTSALASSPLSWSAPQPIDSGHLLYAGVSCPTTSFCAAADDAGDIVTTAEPAGSWSIANVDGSTTFGGIACPSISLCVAVDQTGHVFSSTNPTGGADRLALARADPTRPASRQVRPRS